MFSEFFIERPIFASVIAVVITLAGAVSFLFLPAAQFPEITPPTVQVTASYVGASSDVVESSVTTPLEEQINGVEGTIYMSSTSADDGTSSIIITFEIGYDLDIAAVDVLNRVETARAQLPGEVVRAGITVTKQSHDLTIVPNLYSPDGTYDDLFISNYTYIRVLDVLSRIPGVGDLNVWGLRKYAMRIWLDPEKLAGLGITAEDVANAISQQNQDVAAGRLGAAPEAEDQEFQFTLNTLGRLESVEQFENIIVRAGGEGQIVRIKDLARVELGAESYAQSANVNGKPALPIGVFQRGGANQIELADHVTAAMEQLAERFPKGLEYNVVYDTTQFVRASIREVVITLAQAIGLVVLVIFIFLHGFRTTLIPVVTIPVCLIGTLAVLLALDFSINTLSLFGMVLAVGLVVDDAIVVVENVARHLESETLDPKLAARNAMKQVTGPIIATSLVLMAVFVPVAFTPGITGQFYRQFALTIACAVGISALLALSLSPALCAVLLRHQGGKRAWLSRTFDNGFKHVASGYERAVGVVSRFWYVMLFCFAALFAATIYLFSAVPTGFIPPEDQGQFIVVTQAPEGTSLRRTEQIIAQVEDILINTPGVARAVSFAGFDIITGTSAPNVGTMFGVLEPWQERSAPDEQLLSAILPELQAKLGAIPEAVVVAFNPPAIWGLSPTGGFTFELQDFTGGSLSDLGELTNRLVDKARERPELTGIFTTFSAETPSYFIDLDRAKALTEGVSISSIFTALQTYLGAYYVNDFNKFGRVFRVFLQAESADRSKIEDVSKLYVRNAKGEMVPLSSVVTLKPVVSARTINHYNLFRSSSILGTAAPGYSSSQAIDAMEAVADEVLPETMGYEWTGTAYQQLKAGDVAPYIFALALVFVFLFLAAQYESWAMPFMVVLAVPLAIFGALGAQWLRGLENDIYCQVGLVMLIGLASKNAILIVEFARRRREEGLTIEMAAMEAARIRLRPILMTAFAFILGVTPLALASGPGSNARHSLGTAVLGGMFAATLLSLFIVPVFYVLIERLREKLTRKGKTAPG